MIFEGLDWYSAAEIGLAAISVRLTNRGVPSEIVWVVSFLVLVTVAVAVWAVRGGLKPIREEARICREYL